MNTKQEIENSPCPVTLDEDNNGVWHIIDIIDPTKALCGVDLDDLGIPSDEVPDEITCPKCLQIENSVWYKLTSPIKEFRRWFFGK